MIFQYGLSYYIKNNDSLKLMDIHNQEFILGKEYIDTENKNGSMSVGFPFTIAKERFRFRKCYRYFELILDYDV